MPRAVRSKRWLFTINNPTEAEKVLAAQFCIEAKYGILCRETGEQGTSHIHFFCILHSEIAITTLKTQFPRAHIDKFSGKSINGRDYCKKDGDFDEYGEFPDKQGKRSDWEHYRDWLIEHDRVPTERDVALEWPSLYGRCRTNCLRMLSLLRPAAPPSRDGDLRDWQLELKNELEDDPDDRNIRFMVDYCGGKGKSWFCLHMIGARFEEVQYLSIAKRDDLAHMIDTQKKIFLIDVPRDQMQFLAYPILEQLKNGIVSSPKYESGMKVMAGPCHVVVFCNENPDYTKLSADRIKIKQL